MAAEWLIGGTGSGKTYHAVKKAEQRGRFAYVSPTRLLAVETYESYGYPRDTLSVGTAKIKGDNGGNFFGTYGQLKTDKIKQYKTIIIDEAHFIDGDFLNQRKKIREIIYTAEKDNVKVVCVTATPPYKLDGHAVEELPAKIQFKKSRVSYETAKKRMLDGVKTLVIASARRVAYNYACHVGDSIGDADKVACAWRGMNEVDIYKNFLRFKEGDATILICSNVAQQGINLPCDNIIMFTNGVDNRVNMTQKLGRLGRPFITKENEYLTWWDDYFGDDDVDPDVEIWDGTPPPLREKPRYTEEGDAEEEEDDGYTEERDTELEKFLIERFKNRYEDEDEAAENKLIKYKTRHRNRR